MKKHPGGRPTVMTPTTIKKLEEAFLEGMSDLQACRIADICEKVLYNYCNKNPYFRDRKELLKTQRIIVAKRKLNTLVDQGDRESIKFYLKHKAKDEFGDQQQAEQTSQPEGASLNAERITNRILGKE